MVGGCYHYCSQNDFTWKKLASLHWFDIYLFIFNEGVLECGGVPDQQNVEVWQPSFVMAKDELRVIEGDNEIQLESWWGWIFAMLTAILRDWALIS